MELFGTHIRTPYDATYPEFDRDWRHLVARSWADHPDHILPEEIANDPWVRAHKMYLETSREADDDQMVPDELKYHRYAMAWYGGGNVNQIRFRIEPLLLTGVTFPIIAKDLTGNKLQPYLFQLYERLFFNVREDDGRLNESCWVRMQAALPINQQILPTTPADVLWKYIGMRYGYTGLVWYWGMPDPHGTMNDDTFVMDELWRSAQAVMLENICRRQINNFDLNHNLGQYIEYRRMRHDIGQIEGANEYEKLLQKVLESFAPKLLESANDVDNQGKMTTAIQHRMKAQINVAQQIIPDYGKELGIDGINKMLKKHFNSTTAKE